MIVKAIKICSFRPQLDTGEPAAVGTENVRRRVFNAISRFSEPNQPQGAIFSDKLQRFAIISG